MVFGSQFGEEAAVVGGVDHATGAAGGFVNDYRDSALLQVEGGGESGDACPYDGDGSHGRGPRG